MATLDIRDHSLVVSIEGIDKLFTFRSTIVVPLTHVVGISVRPDLTGIMNMPVHTQFRGVRVPGSLIAGTLVLADGSGNVFCDVRDVESAIAIDLRHDQFKRLIVELTNQSPEDARARIEAALGRPAPHSTLPWEPRPDEPEHRVDGTSR